MDINLFSRLLKNLILYNDRIAVPGIGEFAADTAPAFFSDQGKTINPPYRRFFFSPDCSRQDHILEDYYASISGLDIESAHNEILGMTGAIRAELSATRQVHFPEFGTMRSTSEGIFYFVPDEGISDFFREYGLDSISLKVLTPEKETDAAAIDISEEATSEPTARVSYFDALQGITPGSNDGIEEASTTIELEPEEGTSRTAPSQSEKLPQKKRNTSKVGIVLFSILILLMTIALGILFLQRAGLIDLSSFLYSPEEMEMVSEFSAQE